MSKFLVLVLFTVKLFSCGPGCYVPSFYKDGYFDFLPKLKSPIQNKSYINSRKYEKVKDYYQNIRNSLNIKEWSEYLNIPKNEAKRIVYGNKSPIMIQKNKLISFLAYKKALNTIKDYDTNWTKVEQTFFPFYKREKLSFFKLRVAYNLIKAYHNQKKFDKELKFINSLKRENFPKSIVWEWIGSFKAGAIKNKGDLVTSSYLFSKIFTTHKSDAYIGYYDFEIKSDKQWQKLLKLAKDDEEKTLFYFLRAINPKANKLQELKEMTKIDPNSKWVKTLSLMLAQRVQFLSYYKAEEKLDKDQKRFIKDYLLYLKENKRTKEQKFIYNYLNLIAFNQKPTIHDKLLDYIYYVLNLKTLDEKELSKKLVEISKQYDKSNLERFTIFSIAKLYPKNSIKRFLAKNYENDFRGYFYSDDISYGFDHKSLDEFEKLVQKQDKTYIEKLLSKMNAVSQIDQKDIKLYYSLIYTDEGKYKKAYNMIKNIPLQRKEYENPFNVNFSGDNRTFRKNNRKLYSQKKFLKTMISIENTLKQNPNSVMDNFLKATALYNITCYGSTPVFRYIYRGTTINYDENRLLDNSRLYYQKAFKLTKDRELKAKIIYALMKIEFSKKQKNIDGYDDGYFPTIYENPKTLKSFVLSNKQYKSLYKKLQGYKDTKYFHKIKNCATFKFFK